MKKTISYRAFMEAPSSAEGAEALALSLRDPEVCLERLDHLPLEMDPTRALDRAIAQRASEARDLSARAPDSLRPVRELLDARWGRVDLSHEVGKWGGKPLVRACKARDEELLALLLERGAPPHWGGKGQFADTALGLCLKKGWIRGARLISGYLEPEHFQMRDGRGESAMEALFTPSTKAEWEQMRAMALELAPLWARRGANPSERGPASANEATLLLKAIRESESEEALEALIALGPDLEAADATGTTPLMAAARKGRGSVVDLLLSLGADPLREDSKGRAAREWAKEGGSGVYMGAERTRAIAALTQAERVARERAALALAMEQDAARMGRALSAAFESGARVLIDGEPLDAQGFMERFGGCVPAPLPKRGLKL